MILVVILVVMVRWVLFRLVNSVFLGVIDFLGVGLGGMMMVEFLGGGWFLEGMVLVFGLFFLIMFGGF